MDNPWDQRLGIWFLAEDQPDLPAVVESPSGVTLSFRELAGRAHQIVHALRDRGLGDGDIVAYALGNDIDIVWWQLALQESGIHAIALNPQLSTTEIEAILEHSGARGLVVDHSHEGTAALVDADGLKVRVAVGGSVDGFDRYTDFVEAHPTTVPAGRTLGTPIFYSSGTTGLPKAIGRPRGRGEPSLSADEMKLFARAFQFRPFGGVHLVSAGMTHGGCQGYYHGALTVGQALAILGRFDPEAALAAIERHRVTTAYLVPTQFVRLLRLPDEVKARYDVSSLEVVVHSAAPCPVEVKRQMMKWWGPVIWETYGGTEGAGTIAKPHHWLEKPGTVGRAIRGVRIRILDDDGVELPPGEIGNVFLESDLPTFEYKGDPALTASVYRGKAYTIGDVGYLDDDGFLFICDRAKDMIISGGVNIYPAEVEAVLTTHPAVGDVAVIGVPDEEWGESVKAVVELVDGSTASRALAEELIDHCRPRLAKYKLPRSVEFRDALPRTEAGKLLKRVLREEFLTRP